MEVPLTDNDWSEHYVKRGDPSKPTYYIIRRKWYPGLFATFVIVLAGVKYAISKGWIPVVDMQNCSNMYLAPEKRGKENAWEYYFEQPMRVGLEEARNGENIILSGEKDPMPLPFGMIARYEYNKAAFAEWQMLIKDGIMKIKPEITEEALAIRDKLFPPKKRVLGVHQRGTDFLDKPHGHPILPPTEYAVRVVIDKMHEWKCDKLFLATEDKNILNIFQESFGNCLLIFDKPFVDYVPGKSVGDTRIERKNDRFLSGKEYVIEMLLLSKCNSFIASGGAGANGVMLFAEKDFENTYAFRLGLYGVYPKYKP